ncbi:DNA-binding response regulator [Biomaibacter acetigenes]|uniref:Stage 0 sporulation protein A homolog n=2 Tax=Biomaibacter acetigenes TaxID=2316383 RepID=A0A3G2R4U1_9FIRM|nr:LytTR family DNA-binding domain-containing protein [Biomaibacter acetigenes]AYO30148.1 DNA-binding response regulator [Biomaibacter acetigenes]
MDKYNGTIQLNSDEKLTSFIEEIYTARTGKEAEDIIREESPQILLLDIELPDINGINVAKTAVSLNPDVFVVFITGYSSYATESFEVHPYDYILKPIDFERFHETLNFVTIKCENNILNRKLKAIGKLPVKSGNGILFLNLKDIIFIERLGEKTKIHTKKKAYECTDHLKNLEASLNGNFYRVHKSYIVNMEMVEKIENLRDTYEISFYDYNEKAYMSKGRYQFLKEKFQIRLLQPQQFGN